MMKKVTVQSGQSLWDIAVQHCGSADAALDVAALNGLLPTGQPKTGETIFVPEEENKKVVRYYAEHGIVPATA